MNRTFICDRCPRVAVIVEDDDILLCGDCFLARTVHKIRKANREKKDASELHAA